MISREEKLLSKARLKRFCEQTIEHRMAITKNAMTNAQDAANGEEKSSAGDKYETSRAMNHLEKDMHARQLVAHAQELNALQAINTNIIYDTAVPGAFIECEKVSFYIAAGLGKQLIENTPIIFLSPQSPMARKLAGKKAGDDIEFNEKIIILDIF